MHRLRAYLQLVRLPAVFTAMADIFLGFALRRGDLSPAFDLGLLLVASSGLYLSGMAFNDVFDRHIDARQRPQRPIPSGRILVTVAVQVGGVLMLAGLVAANAVGAQSLLIAAILAVSILAYNALLKTTLLGPVAMGLCRFLNIWLGASFVDPDAAVGMYLSWSRVDLPVLGNPQTYVAAALGTYIAGVTWFARQEAGISSRFQLMGALGIINLGLGGLMAYIAGIPGLLPAWPGRATAGPVIITLGVIVLVLNRRLVIALLDPVPKKVQPAVKTLLLSLIVLDATLIFYHTNNPAFAVGTAALLFPALLLGRWVFVT